MLWLTAGWGKDVLTVLKTVGGSDLRFFLYVPLESPCSPMIQPCTLFGGMFSFSPIKKWNRAVSRLVPLPITRSAGRPLIFHATYVKTSTETWRKNRYCYTSECGSGSSRGCLIERFHSASMQIYWNKRKRLYEKSVKFPTWPPWCHVKTLYSRFSHDVIKIQTKKLSILLRFWVSWGITAPKHLYLNRVLVRKGSSFCDRGRLNF